MNFIEQEMDTLEYLKCRPHDEVMQHAIYLANMVIEHNRLGRAQDRAMDALLGKQRMCHLQTKTIMEAEKQDGFYEQEQKFFEKFGEGAEDGSLPQ